MKARFYLICTFLCGNFLTKAQENELRTADSLYKAGRYFEASVSYERMLYNNYNIEWDCKALTGKLQCLKKQQQYQVAADFIMRNNDNKFPDSIRSQFLYQQALCLYLAGNFDNCLSLIRQINYLYPNFDNNRMLQLLNILSLNELKRWQEGQAEYQNFIRHYFPEDSTAFQNPYIHIPKLKNENTAQWLSTFLPGAGELYAGKPIEALASIILQGTAIYFGIVSWQQKYYFSTWFVGAGLFASFHNGGVRRSEKLVQIYNKKQVMNFNERIKKQMIELINNH